jgi:tetratricopeptide (TPR) repeat protein
MRVLLALALSFHLFSRLAFTEPCTGAERQLEAARLAIAQKNADEADRILSPLQASHPDCPDLVLSLARVRGVKGDVAQANNLFLRYTELEPKDARGFYYFARFLFNTGAYERAASVTNQAVALDPKYAAPLVLKGQLLAMQGQIPLAEQALKDACALDPKDAVAHFELGSLYDAAKRNPEAVKQFQRVVALNPSDANAWDYLALNLEPSGEVERAEEAYRKGLAVNQAPAFDSFLDYNYGRFLFKRNRLKESKKHLDRAAELAPRVRAVWYERAKVNLRLQNYGEARADAERALGLADSSGVIIDLQVYYLLESIYRRMGETELADKYARLSRDTPVPLRKQRQ